MPYNSETKFQPHRIGSVQSSTNKADELFISTSILTSQFVQFPDQIRTLYQAIWPPTSWSVVLQQEVLLVGMFSDWFHVGSCQISLNHFLGSDIDLSQFNQSFMR